MFKHKFIFLVATAFLLTSCGDTWRSLKGGLTGEKRKTTDEFLVKKKDPLILPPNFEDLPTPSDRELASEEISIFEKTLKGSSSAEIGASTSASTEQSILRQIKKK